MEITLTAARVEHDGAPIADDAKVTLSGAELNRIVTLYAARFAQAAVDAYHAAVGAITAVRQLVEPA